MVDTACARASHLYGLVHQLERSEALKRQSLPMRYRERDRSVQALQGLRVNFDQSRSLFTIENGSNDSRE